jgi:hypothetical protein
MPLMDLCENEPVGVKQGNQSLFFRSTWHLATLSFHLSDLMSIRTVSRAVCSLGLVNLKPLKVVTGMLILNSLSKNNYQMSRSEPWCKFNGYLPSIGSNFDENSS